MSAKQIIILTFSLLAVSLADSSGKEILPFWKNLLIHHKEWSGYIMHHGDRSMCSMYVHSVQYDSEGGSRISFSSENIKIEMMGYSQDNQIVTFKEVHIWNKSGHFDGQSDLHFTGSFIKPDEGLYKFEATVSSTETPMYGMVTLIPEVESPPRSKPERKGVGLALAIGIPMLLGAVVFTLAALIVVWAVRKGYLRHVPWMYKNFTNPKERKDVEMKAEEEPTPVVLKDAETTAVHI